MRVAWRVALRFLFKKRSAMLTASSRAALAAISLGVAALVVSLCLMNGYRDALKAGILNASGHLLLQPSSQGEEQVGGFFHQRPEVAWVGPVHFLAGLAVPDTGGGGEVVTLKATDKLPPFVTVSLAPRDGGLPVAMGRGLAEKLGVGEGQAIFLQLAHPAGRPIYLSAKVAQIFSAGFTEIDQAWLFCAEQALLRQVPGLPHGLFEVYLRDPELAPKLAEEITSQVQPLAFVQTWQNLNRELFAALRWQKVTLALVLSLILGVGAFEVASSLVVLITEKRRELGILMAMGAPSWLVRRVVVMAGCALGASGVLVGLVFGGVLVALANWAGLPHFSPELASVYMVDRIPWKLEALDLVAVLLGGLVEVFVASVITARSFSCQQPAEILRWA